MNSVIRGALLSMVLAAILPPVASAATIQKRYYAHAAVHDRHGVIAPWYTGQNGQLDFRIRVAAETLKRYPWTTTQNAAAALPHYVFNGHWKIAPDGTITPVPINDWDNGDLGQRAAYILSGLVDYYRYSGDPAAIAHITYQANALLDYCLTPADHPWPKFLISVPIKGKPYYQASPKGMIQLDIVAEVGIALLKSYQLTGETRWFDACKHWGDLLAAKRNRSGGTGSSSASGTAARADKPPVAPARQAGSAPWGRYANPECAPWKDDKQTGGVVFLLYFFDDLIRLGYTGKDGEIVKARDAGRAYVRDVLLPNWTVNDTWGRNYWDWPDPVQAENVTEFAARYFMDNKAAFPNWKNDTRNILSLFLNHTSVCPTSRGEVYSGAWAYPESSGCCARSLWYGPMELAVPFAQYGVEAQSPWAREMARRMQILATYDGHETGVSEDNLDGGFVVNADWFKIAHPMALKHLLATMAWMPEEFGPARENHIMHSTAVVNEVQYWEGGIGYNTFDAPPDTIDTLRLKFEPKNVVVRPNETLLVKRQDLVENGYTLKPLRCGDYLVTIRHDGYRRVAVLGKDSASDSHALAGALSNDPRGPRMALTGKWDGVAGPLRTAEQAGASASAEFTGNRIRVVGNVAPDGGLAEVYLDGVKQLVGIDCWNPKSRGAQTLYYRSGLSHTKHTLKIVVLGRKNPYSNGNKVSLQAVEWSSATGTSGFGEGGGPTEAQRMVLGYPGREDIKDSGGQLWRPGTEVVTRLGTMKDSVAESWRTTPVKEPIAGTSDPKLYRYGVHAKEFLTNVTVGPGTYHVRLKFAATRGLDTCQNCVTAAINGKEVVRKMDVMATAGGPNRAVDLVFNGIQPRNGVIDLRFTGGDASMGVAGEAFAQAIEVGPGDGGQGAKPVTVLGRNLLRARGFRHAGPHPSPLPKGEGTKHPSPLPKGEGTEHSGPLPKGEGTGIVASGKGHHRLVQEVGACPNREYRAAVVVSARDVKGQGFGRRSGDSAGMILEEVDGSGKVLVAHPEAAITQPASCHYLSTRITTKPNTARLRFVLDTVLGCDAEQGLVSYDQCILDGPPAPASVTGKVTDEQKKPIEGALVTVEGQSVRTGPAGTFAVAGLSDLMTISVQAGKQGRYPLARVMVLSAGENRCDLALPALPTNNLLANGDFEKGFASARSMEHGTSGVRGPWSFKYPPGVACYIYPESTYTWRKPRIFRGKEAISHVTDGNGQLELSQDVVVDPNTRLVASAWVQGLDVEGNGKGFGAGAKDFAGFQITELDAQGHVLVTHERVGLRKATPDFQRVSATFTTGPKTAKLRFTLLSVIECIWQKGAAIYDDCALEKR